MKLSKDDLKRLVWHSQAGLTDCDSLAWLEFIDGILNGRYDEPLEIEGYERSEWIKFDPNDPKTIPPKNTVVLLTIQGLPLEDNIHTWRTNLQERHNAQGLPGVFTHWRKLPNPPVETEKK